MLSGIGHPHRCHVTPSVVQSEPAPCVLASAYLPLKRREEVNMARGKSAGNSGGKYRSAITGKYVSARYGKSHPKATVKESK